MASVKSAVKVLILEEVELYRRIYEPLASAAGMDILGVCGGFDQESIESVVAENRPDVLLVGSRKPDSAVIAGLKEIRRQHRGLGIVFVFSTCAGDAGNDLKKLARAGQGGMALFLRESLDQLDQLRRIVLSVSRGQVVLDPELTSCLFAEDVQSPFLNELTPKETEILELVARGYTNASIARTLFVDIKTVEHHLNSIYGKLKASNDMDNCHPRVTVTRVYLKETGELQAS